MRISDWSSDVCSSDLARDGTLELATGDMPLLAQDAAAAWLADLAALWQDGQSRPLAFAPDAAFAWLEKLDKDDDEAAAWQAARSEERRVGKECVRTCRIRGWP